MDTFLLVCFERSCTTGTCQNCIFMHQIMQVNNLSRTLKEIHYTFLLTYKQIVNNIKLFFLFPPLLAFAFFLQSGICYEKHRLYVKDGNGISEITHLFLGSTFWSLIIGAYFPLPWFIWFFFYIYIFYLHLFTFL